MLPEEEVPRWDPRHRRVPTRRHPAPGPCVTTAPTGHLPGELSAGSPFRTASTAGRSPPAAPGSSRATETARCHRAGWGTQKPAAGGKACRSGEGLRKGTEPARVALGTVTFSRATTCWRWGHPSPPALGVPAPNRSGRFPPAPPRARRAAWPRSRRRPPRGFPHVSQEPPKNPSWSPLPKWGSAPHPQAVPQTGSPGTGTAGFAVGQPPGSPAMGDLGSSPPKLQTLQPCHSPTGTPAPGGHPAPRGDGAGVPIGGPPRDARPRICSHRGSAAPGRPNPLSTPGLRPRPHVTGTAGTRLGPPGHHRLLRVGISPDLHRRPDGMHPPTPMLGAARGPPHPQPGVLSWMGGCRLARARWLPKNHPGLGFFSPPRDGRPRCVSLAWATARSQGHGMAGDERVGRLGCRVRGRRRASLGGAI